MLFNSIDFAVFLPLVFVMYWFIFNRNLKAQNALVVLASYVFYGWWDWRFLSLIIFSTLVDYLVGIRLSKTSDRGTRKALLLTSIIVNLGFLGFFKYYNFFLDNFISAFSLLGRPINGDTLNIILPVGISFYTFQTLSYTIDVYKNKLEPTRDLIAFSAFVAFFPQLVAGPIERASNLLPQFYGKRSFNYAQAVDGMRQILWGLFKKVVIADNCALFVNEIFSNYSSYSGSTLLLGAFLFSFQIYGDFSGYSDIAIGTARLFGFHLMRNFAFPYFSRDIAEFWRRWHISLSTWFRDYLYIPLGGSKGNKVEQIRNIFIIFLVSGFWHGANWTFIIWGALNALYFLPIFLLKLNRHNLQTVAMGQTLPSIRELMAILVTFLLTVFAWIIFRSNNLQMAFEINARIFSSFWFNDGFQFNPRIMLTISFIVLLVIYEWKSRDSHHGLERLFIKSWRVVRWSFYYVLIVLIAFFAMGEQQFIYFQF